MKNRDALFALINDNKKLKTVEMAPILSSYRSTIFDDNNLKSILWTIETKMSDDTRFSSLKSAIEKNFNAYLWEIQKMYDENVKILAYFDTEYPSKLKTIKNPPFTLFHKGKLLDFSKCIAIVGTRNLSHYGHKKTREISGELASKKFTIVSGLARGVDTEAHCGALDANGKTIAVLPGDIFNIYPQENESLSRDIVENGAILSDISPLEKLTKLRFIERNRITSGLADCIVIIETMESGGTFQQVNVAKEQGKKIFVLYPRERDVDSLKGFNKLVSLGAEPFESVDTIINFLNNPKLASINKKIVQNLSLFNIKND
jgi:DNA processing protein